SSKTEHEYRLPTEAEWEYACRAGTTTPFHFGETITPNLANYDGKFSYGLGFKGTYRERTTKVSFFAFANAFGLFDMHGNIWEWCLDDWHENYDCAPTNGDAWVTSNQNKSPVLRGGAWRSGPRVCRSAFRQYSNSSYRFKDTGFRVVCLVLSTH
ncbi:MAG: formylglycine-generating enzyme family protein, partial [Symploca sp. SIO1C4]|nr:formylglycine-generating enzyme family protein [Symploca sp. SIO1C4]